MRRSICMLAAAVAVVNADATNNILNGSPLNVLKNGILNNGLDVLHKRDTTNNILNGSPFNILQNGVLNALPGANGLLGKRDFINNIANGSPIDAFSEGILNGPMGVPTGLLGKRSTNNNILNGTPVNLFQNGVANNLFQGRILDKRQAGIFGNLPLLQNTPVDFLKEGVLRDGILNGARFKREEKRQMIEELVNELLGSDDDHNKRFTASASADANAQAQLAAAQNAAAQATQAAQIATQAAFQMQREMAANGNFDVNAHFQDARSASDFSTDVFNGSPFQFNSQNSFTNNIDLNKRFSAQDILSQNDILNSAPVNVASNGVLNNVLGKRGVFSGDFLNKGLLASLFRGKGIAATTSYGARVHVHADIAANIAVDIPSQNGLLSSLTSLVGGICSMGSVVSSSPSTTTVLNVKADADVTVSVGLATDLRLALPTGCAALFTSDSIFGSAQVGIQIALDADVNAQATLVTPVLDLSASVSVGLLKLVPSEQGVDFLSIPVAVDSGRMVANLGSEVRGTYIFVKIQN